MTSDLKQKLITAMLDEWERAADAPSRTAQKSELIEEIGAWKARAKLLIELARGTLGGTS